jgi:hypothetical protein
MKQGFIKRPSLRMMLILVIVILIIGVGVGLTNYATPSASSTTYVSEGGEAAPVYGLSSGVSNSGSNPPTNQPIGSGAPSSGGGTTVVSAATTVMTMSSSSSGPSTYPLNTNAVNGSSGEGGQPSANAPQLQNSSGNNSGFIEFFSNATLTVSSTQNALSKATAVAYNYGGYLAFSSYNNVSSIAVLRIPAQNYASALSQIEGLGTLTGLTSNSNDVSIQYTDLNATLQSLLTEQASLLKLENSSNSLNATLLLTGQIQNVDAQINEIQSQILQTRLLITYSTITVTFNVEVPSPPPVPLGMKLTATPTSGLSPLSVTFNAIVTGGDQPYIINYNFGDGTTYQGASLIHTFTSGGTFNVTVTATDSNGSAVENFTIIHVKAAPVATGFVSFWGYALGLLISVVEGIVEVAVVLLPIALVVFVVLLPFRNRLRAGGSSKTTDTSNH